MGEREIPGGRGVPECGSVLWKGLRVVANPYGSYEQYSPVHGADRSFGTQRDPLFAEGRRTRPLPGAALLSLQPSGQEGWMAMLVGETKGRNLSQSLSLITSCRFILQEK